MLPCPSYAYAIFFSSPVLLTLTDPRFSPYPPLTHVHHSHSCLLRSCSHSMQAHLGPEPSDLIPA